MPDVAQELAVISHSHRYNLRHSTQGPHILAAMTVQEATIIYGDAAVKEAGRTELQDGIDRDV